MITRMRRLLSSLFVLFALALPVAAFATDAPSPTVVAACQAEYTQLGADAFKAKYGATEPFGHCYAAHTPAVTTTTTTTTSADDPAAAACKAEYLKLGADAFKAKYGATEPYGNCLRAFGGAPKPQPQPPSSDSPAVAACKAEYQKIGGDAFKAKYGANDPLEACVKAQQPSSAPPSNDSPAVAACKAEYQKIGGDAFKAKYGTDNPLAACVKGQQSPGGDKPKPSGSNGDDGAASVAGAFCSAEGKALGKAVFLAKYGPSEAMGNCVKATLAKAKALVASCKASSGSSKDAFKACIAAGVGVPPRRR